MKTDIVLTSKNGYLLKVLLKADVTDNYLEWMNDPVVVRYTESKYIVHTRNSLESFVENCMKRENCILFGIFDSEKGIHIGNIKIDNIHFKYKHADIGLIIGRKEYWGRGVATEAIRLCTEFSFQNLKLHKVWAGCYEKNFGSLKAFINNDYSIAYVKRDEVFMDDKYMNCYVLEKFNKT